MPQAKESIFVFEPTLELPAYVYYVMKEYEVNWQEILGFVGGAITTVSLVPQVWRLFRLKSAREISMFFAITLLVGVVCWLIYGILLNLSPVIVWNAITVPFALAMLYAKIKYGK